MAKPILLFASISLLATFQVVVWGQNELPRFCYNCKYREDHNEETGRSCEDHLDKEPDDDDANIQAKCWGESECMRVTVADNNDEIKVIQRGCSPSKCEPCQGCTPPNPDSWPGIETVNIDCCDEDFCNQATSVFINTPIYALLLSLSLLVAGKIYGIVV